jgi:hypothetical protein
MGEWSANRVEQTAERATAIWDRLLGCFGDRLIRKFGKTPPAEWIAAVGFLNQAQLERGLRRLLFGGKSEPPSLPEFMRICRAIGSDDFDEGRPTMPALAGPDTWLGDAWDAAANKYLMGHLATQMQHDSRKYGRPASAKSMQTRREDSPNGDASPEFVANVGRLRQAKALWAADMRDMATDGEVPVEIQKAVWKDYIGRAEADIARGIIT